MIVQTRDYTKGWAILIKSRTEFVAYHDTHVFGNGFFRTRRQARDAARYKRKRGHNCRVVRACVLFQTEP